MSFVPAAGLLPVAERVLAQHAAAIAELLPAAEVEHVGATSVPGAITKGDLDLLVRVRREEFGAAIQALRERYAIHQPENWSGDYASFAWTGESPLPVGVQLVVAGTPEDTMFGRLRALLLARPEALKRLNELKRSFEGADYDSYTAAKGDLIESLLAGAVIRLCRDDEREAILAIVNTAAEAYRGVIPADRWREPYMPAEELDAEIVAGVAFWGYEDGGALVGVMGVQPVDDVDLIRHAYVVPAGQGRGVGTALLEHLAGDTGRRILVGTWAAAEWAIRFYRRNGFELVGPERTADLLRTYWSIPDRQIQTSVVLARPPL